MKKILLLAVSFFTVNVFATKARILSLGRSMHVVDYQDMPTNPMRVHLPSAVILETGITNSVTNRDNAEAVVVYKLNDKSSMAAAVGKSDDPAFIGRSFMNSIVGAGTYRNPQNAIHGIYGLRAEDGTKYSMGASYSNYNDKLIPEKESSSGLFAGMATGPHIWWASYGLANTVEKATQKFNGGGALRASGRYMVGEWLYGVDLANWIAKSSTSGTDNESYGIQTVQFRVVNSQKKDGTDVFYGVGIASNVVDCKTKASTACSTKYSSLVLPVIIGIEVNAADWLTVRGAVTQNVLLATNKDEIGLPAASGFANTTGAATDFGNAPNSTAVSAGLGFKLKKELSLDGTLATATTQNIDTNNFLVQVGATYLY